MEIPTAQFEPEVFQYETLPTTTSIRLLTLFNININRAGGTSRTEPIEGLLRTVDLEDCPIYKTLSYTWGNPSRKIADPAKDPYDVRYQLPFIVNGRLVFVSRSLDRALRHLLTLSEEDRSIDKRLVAYNKTELIRSSQLGWIKRVLYCLDHGADIHTGDQVGATALHYAALRCYPEIVQLLLAHGADTSLRDNTGKTPLDYCMVRRNPGYENIAQILREAPIPERKQGCNPRPEEQEMCHWDFWIDSICINQKDITERNAQVMMMGRIYSSSISTVVWLGDASKKTRETLSIVAKVNEAWDTDTRVDTEEVATQRRAAMDVLRTRSWFRRRWVIQEYCLAQDTEIYCGRTEIDRMRLSQWGDPSMNRLFSLRNWYASKSGTTIIAYGETPPLPNLLSLAIITFGSESSDLRDSIFALAGLAARSSELTGPQHRLVVDYNKSVTQVLIEIGRQLMEAKMEIYKAFWDDSGMLEPLHALSLTQIKPAARVDGVPSWVPNFHKEEHTRKFNRPAFCASGKSSKCKIWPSPIEVLKVDAHMLDTVAAIEQNHPVNEAGYRKVVHLSEWFDVASDEHGIIRVEALWRTLMADDAMYQPSLEPATEPVSKRNFKDFLCKHVSRAREDPEKFESILHRLELSRTRDNDELIPTIQDIDGFGGLERARSLDGRGVSTNRFESCLNVYYANRILFRTGSGYLGLALDTIQPGDQIWLLAGTRTPFALRHVENIADQEQFHFIAECYVHDAMYGEAVEERDDLVFKPVEIV